jgi:regulatory protein
MAIITALVVQQKNKQRVNVELDGSFGFGLALNLALGLRRGQMLDEAAIAALQTQDAVEMAWERVIRLLAIRARSAQEIRQYLQRNAAEPTIIDSVIARLQERNYLDDAEFAKAWVQNRTTFRPKGARVLQHELRQKGIAPEDIQTALAGLDESRQLPSRLPRKFSAATKNWHPPSLNSICWPIWHGVVSATKFVGRWYSSCCQPYLTTTLT